MAYHLFVNNATFSDDGMLPSCRLLIRTTHNADAHSALKRCAHGLECTQHSVHSKS